MTDSVTVEFDWDVRANPNLTVAADKKSYTLKVQGWNWTYTPSIVK